MNCFRKLSRWRSSGRRFRLCSALSVSLISHRLKGLLRQPGRVRHAHEALGPEGTCVGLDCGCWSTLRLLTALSVKQREAEAVRQAEASPSYTWGCQGSRSSHARQDRQRRDELGEQLADGARSGAFSLHCTRKIRVNRTCHRVQSSASGHQSGGIVRGGSWHARRNAKLKAQAPANSTEIMRGVVGHVSGYTGSS